MRAPFLCSTLLAAALTLLVGSSALAGAPTRTVLPIDDHFTASPGTPGFTFNPCRQDLLVDQVGTLYITDYFDQAGNLIRELATTPQLYITITGPNGNSLTGLSPASSHTTFDFSANTLTAVFTGQQYRFSIPGTGSPEHMADNVAAGFGALPDAAMRKKMADYFDSL